MYIHNRFRNSAVAHMTESRFTCLVLDVYMQQMIFVYEVKRENEEYSKLVQQVYHITLQITFMIER